MSFFETKTNPADKSRLVFLQGLTAKEWSKVYTFAEMRKFVGGEVLVNAGDSDDSFYIMTAGSAQVLQAQKVIGQIAEGSVFGEVAFFDRQPRSATIRALGEGSAARFTRTAFENLAAWEPVLARRMLYELGHALAIRLRAAERRLGGA
jgi:CRP-like cAMP-binding protein